MATHTSFQRDGSYSLTELGIQLDKRDGSSTLAIEIPSGPGSSNTNTTTIVFNPTSKKWRMVDSKATGGDVSSSAPSRPPSSRTRSHQPVSKASSWIDLLPDTEHVNNLFRGFDWASTSLGPPEGWPASLQTLLHFLMGDSMASCIYWGPELRAIYNAEMAHIIKTRLHRDSFLGQPFKEAWPDVWAESEAVLKEIARSGSPMDSLQVHQYPVSDGGTEETFWMGTFIALKDIDGSFQGFYNRGRETTKEIVAKRRIAVLNAIASSPELAGEYVWEHLFNAFRKEQREFPMAFVYRAQDNAEAGKCKLQLRQSIGLPPDGHPLVPEEMDMYEGQDGFAPFYRKARFVDQPHMLHVLDGTLTDDLIKGFQWQGFEEPSRSVAIIAISSSDRLLGIMVIGLNPRRPFDADYEGFLSSLTRHTSSTVTNALDKEEARLRAGRLESQLADREREIRELAVHGPVGMVQVTISGKITWANDQFWQLTGHSSRREDQYELSWLEVVDPVDQEVCAELWRTLTEERQSTNQALRLRRKWKPPVGPEEREPVEEPIWVSAMAYPILEGGEIKAVASTITDISHYKWAEATQARNAEAAKEAKRLQENFIDIVSHEMRNPLSAITQLADAISTSSEELAENNTLENAKEIIASCAESASTILLCAGHQKRVIDDVLTLSKLDSMMLSITPVVVQPQKVAQAVLKMFEGEFNTNGIAFEVMVEKTYKDMNVDWVMVDPSRLTQILINLVSNAVKFTKLEEKREIKLRSSVTLIRPPSLSKVQWFPTGRKYRDPTLGKEWGDGEPIYLCFEVKDTGRGLEQAEMNKLFGRFQQATAKTHIKYGGSGLGLFISRELTETQGGEIGVISNPGLGSTFAFYVKGRRAQAPDAPATMLPLRIEDKLVNHTGVINKAHRLSSSPGQSNASLPSSPPEKPYLLLVEDNVVNSKVLSHQLRRAKYDVHIANHGMEALDFLNKTGHWKGNEGEADAIKLDCILMDVEMPIMDGLMCTRRIRQLEDEGQLKKKMVIIATTANARQEQINTVLQAGADAVMSKPFTAKELMAKIEEVTGGRR